MPCSKNRGGKSDFPAYFDPKHPGSFCGVSGFLKNNKNVDKEKFKQWAGKVDCVTLHRLARKSFPRRRMLVFSTGDLLQIDLMDFQKLSKFNQGCKFVLVAIDVFSKFAYAIPLKRKTGKQVLSGLKVIVQDILPRKIQCDRGLEFVNQTISQWLKSKGIEMYSTYNYDIKACVVERFIRTFKGRLYRYFTENSTQKYVDVLAKITDSYNSSFHRTIKMTPKDARKHENQIVVYNNLYRNTPSSTCSNPKYKLNDAVRVSRYPDKFLKAYTQNFSMEYFFIDSVERTLPIVYKLRDLKGEKIMGTFYEQELQKISINSQKSYDIEAILSEKGNKVLVKYLGWPSKFNEWRLKTDLKKKDKIECW